MVALLLPLRAQVPETAPAPGQHSPAAVESPPAARAKEGEIDLKSLTAAAKEWHGLEEAMQNAATPEEKADARKAIARHRARIETLKDRLNQAKPVGNEKARALTRKLNAIVIRSAAFQNATLREVLKQLTIKGMESDPDLAGVPLSFSPKDGETEPLVTFHLEDASLHLLLQVVAEQAGLALDIGDARVSLRQKSAAVTENKLQGPSAARVVEDVAFFEKKYQRKIVGVKPISEYADPDAFYAAIASQLGIAEIAQAAAAARFGWKADDGKVTRVLVKGGPTAAGGPGSWDVSILRFALNPGTQQPERASMEIKMVQIDYDGLVKFPSAK